MSSDSPQDWRQRIPVRIFNELQVGLVPLLQTLQQHAVLGPLQLQLPHLGMGKVRVVGSFKQPIPYFVHSAPPPSW